MKHLHGKSASKCFMRNERQRKEQKILLLCLARSCCAISWFQKYTKWMLLFYHSPTHTHTLHIHTKTFQWNDGKALEVVLLFWQETAYTHTSHSIHGLELREREQLSFPFEFMVKVFAFLTSTHHFPSWSSSPSAQSLAIRLTVKCERLNFIQNDCVEAFVLCERNQQHVVFCSSLVGTRGIRFLSFDSMWFIPSHRNVDKFSSWEFINKN